MPALSLALPQEPVGFAFVDGTDWCCARPTSHASGQVLSFDCQAALHRRTGGLIATGVVQLHPKSHFEISSISFGTASIGSTERLTISQENSQSKTDTA
mmetsp:Transcript_7808/g.15223  ORF Transcript_7808/g.15223 Transcript_7808/m.15223 type:complete len:99 (+) Transcript_7808:75-371(+)